MSHDTPGAFFREEITSQGKTWAEIIPLVTRQATAIKELFARVDEVIFSGCGSGFNAALYAASILQMQTGFSARAVAAAEIYLFPKGVLVNQRKTLAVLISRSGKTTEVVRALDYLRRHGIRTIGITCTADSPLAQGCDLALVLTPALDQAVATTRSFTGMTLAAQFLAAIVADDEANLHVLHRLPELCQAQMEHYHDLGKALGQRTDLSRYACVGNGPFFGLAREAQLKIKETALLPADAYPMLEFRHGPQSTVDGQTLVIAFLSDRARQEEVRFVRDMKALRGVIWTLCDHADEELRLHADYMLELNSDLPELVRGLLYMPAVQYMAYYRSLAQGLNPDQPRNLSYWVDTSR
ncbi:MAG: SIS domain-containing protein [Chloroflexi bacterium]|nr:SIS domain-containing protein [Chloroflexota bacterium]